MSLVAGRKNEILASLALVDAGGADVFDGGLPAVIDGAGDGAGVGGRDFEHHGSGVPGVVEGHEVEGVGVGGEGLVLPVEETRPEDDLVAALASLGVVDHGLDHAVEVDGGHAPDDSLDGAAAKGALGEIFGGEACGGGICRWRGPWLVATGDGTEENGGCCKGDRGVLLHSSSWLPLFDRAFYRFRTAQTKGKDCRSRNCRLFVLRIGEFHQLDSGHSRGRQNQARRSIVSGDDGISFDYE